MRLAIDVEFLSLFRKVRKTKHPDPATFISLIEMAGASGIVAHLREDQTLLNERDVKLIKEIVQTHFNLYVVPTDDMLRVALNIAPDMVTFVPEKRNEFTSQGGLDVYSNEEYLIPIIETLQANDIVVSLFIEPDVYQIKPAAKIGADYIELDTKPYAEAKDLNTQTSELENIKSVVSAAAKLGLGISVGRGLDYHNIQEIAKIPYIEELNLGYAVVSRAMYVGIQQAVSDMQKLIV